MRQTILRRIKEEGRGSLPEDTFNLILTRADEVGLASIRCWTNLERGRMGIEAGGCQHKCNALWKKLSSDFPVTVDLIIYPSWAS